MPTLTSVTVSPPNPFILTTTTQQFTATAHFSDAPDLDVTSSVSTSWVSSDTSVATIGLHTGLATALSISGSTTISATYNLHTGTAVLRVGTAEYLQVREQLIDPVKVTETVGNAAHNPILRLTTPYLSQFTGTVVFKNVNGSMSNGLKVGWTLVSGHSGDFTRDYIANEAATYGNWVQINSGGFATTSLNGSQRNLGIVASKSFDMNGGQVPFSGSGAGGPVLVQVSGDGYVSTTDNTIVLGSFLGPDTNGKVHAITFNPSLPTPILGFALENFSHTYQNMVLMRIQICGE